MINQSLNLNGGVMKVVSKEASEFLSVPAFAEALGISEATARSWILYRRIEVVRIGRRVLIKTKTLEALIARGTVPVLKGHELV